MNRILAVAAFALLILSSAAAEAQSWIFQPGNHTRKTHGPQAPATEKKPHAYATFTESQAAQAAKMPKPPFQWDPTGVIGRGNRYDMWTHQEAMEATRLRTYAQGVRDAVGGRPIWTWHAPVRQPMPQILAPTAKAAGKAHPAGRP